MHNIHDTRVQQHGKFTQKTCVLCFIHQRERPGGHEPVQNAGGGEGVACSVAGDYCLLIE